MAQALAGTPDTAAARSATTGKAPDLFELKSASLSLLSLVLKTADLAALEQSLVARLGETPDAFHHDPLLVDLSQLPLPGGDASAEGAAPAQAVSADAGTGDSEAVDAPPKVDANGQLSLDALSPAGAVSAEPQPIVQATVQVGPAADAARLDLAALLPLLRRHRLQPVGVVGANAAELSQAAELGLAEAPEAPAPVARAEPRVETVVQQVIKEVVVERQVEVPVMSEARTVFVDKPLRSGQQVYAKGADLVVLALVNHGAEVIADGNIHIYAPLRGKAIAGARGNTDARIFAQCLEAELIAIAGIYRTTENPLPDNVRGKAAMVRLDGEKLLMDPLPQ
ncbi:septum site-determining protein MinC [Roseateles depolymerans]|uniref:Probable septum site-determining protein MinC n=1 Tax=Roseateles depolymerans TaxID=76731 RepID=A0A0U3CY35_9BURK|nr:Septum formation inhibitor MinC [Roseateles depolymerans]REG19248.1 septum site-determining protein MinC [Roseateles depolymerans]